MYCLQSIFYVTIILTKAYVNVHVQVLKGKMQEWSVTVSHAVRLLDYCRLSILVIL